MAARIKIQVAEHTNAINKSYLSYSVCDFRNDMVSESVFNKNL